VTSFNIGTKIGTGRKASGVRGGSFHGGTLTLRFDCNLTLYGCFVDSGGSLQILNGNGAVIDIAGCTFDAIGSYVIGSTTPATLTIYNTTFSSTTTGVFCTNSTISDSQNLVWAAPTPLQFFSSSTFGRSFRRMGFVGAVTGADIRMQTGAGVGGGYLDEDLSWSDTAGKPRLIMNSITTATDGFHDYRTMDTKVVDQNGNALAGIPVYLESDVDGGIFDTVTLSDGNVSFTNGVTGDANVVVVRDYYADTAATDGSNVLARDRTFTLWVNSYKSGVYSPIAGYETKRVTFEWPGRDRFGTGYQTDGGSFLVAMDIVRLEWGNPSHVDATNWVELSL
jgi:hypothetical protein